MTLVYSDPHGVRAAGGPFLKVARQLPLGEAQLDYLPELWRYG